MANPNPIIDASLLLSKGDLALFVIWQEKEFEVVPDYQGMFSAISYSAFVSWCSSRDESTVDVAAMAVEALQISADSSYKVATMCKHPLHPVTESIPYCPYCPLCEVDACLKLIDAVGQAKKSAKSRQLRNGWRRARLELARLISCLENQSDLEAEWNREFEDQKAQEITNSATKAVKHYAQSIEYPGKTISHHSHIPSPKGVKSSHKSVSFTPDTADGTHRKPKFFCRKRVEYQEGSHTASTGYGLVDSSLMHNSLFTLAQMKTYVIKSDGTEEAGIRVYLDLASLVNEGCAGSHALWKQILAYWQFLLTDKSREYASVLKKELKQGEFVVVLLHPDTKKLSGLMVGKEGEGEK